MSTSSLWYSYTRFLLWEIGPQVFGYLTLRVLLFLFQVKRLKWQWQSQGKSGMCKHTDFVEFISVSIVLSSEHLKVGMILVWNRCLLQQFLNLEKEGIKISCGHERIHLAANKHIICDFEGSLVESALALLATYYVLMYNYPPGLIHFFIFLHKCILHIQDGKKLPSSVIS